MKAHPEVDVVVVAYSTGLLLQGLGAGLFQVGVNGVFIQGSEVVV